MGVDDDLASVSGTATGRAFAAWLPDELVRPTMRANLPKSVTDRFVGRAQPWEEPDAARIRAEGIATVAEPPIPGINAIAAPVFDHLGQVFAVITLVGDARLLDKAPDTEFAAALRGAAQALSADLGHWESPEPS
ncbi:IclR family transcriptional regulator domain-containing protein [Mangrovicoccus ximenensis]|uniref:IclR family transcriptional regulator domain-containing protein n=1 Tax=Mangrovicoccus ximenensis TaxID=1911570 RepID=UPI0022A9F90A|nr:IclR family transcriptional regulator C-terminal domain-containing protein [Mangrovicoccus ximenensis]